jgi:23S rRNA pseudouridine2604 synthase
VNPAARQLAERLGTRTGARESGGPRDDDRRTGAPRRPIEGASRRFGPTGGASALANAGDRAKPADTRARPQPGRPAGQSGTHSTSSLTHDDAPGQMRLSKRMSELGLCSRREADEWIENGWVRVDGHRVDTLGAKVTPSQHIEVLHNARAAQAKQVTIVVHKPVGYVSNQPEGDYPPAVVLVTPENRWSGDAAPLRFSATHLRSLAPAGRLDIDSTGLLILTQDGRIAKQLIGEHSDIDKEYLVRVRYGDVEQNVDQQFPAHQLELLRYGLSLDDVQLKPAQVTWQNGEQLRFVLREGRKRQIRRMCELVGLEVLGLKRVRMGDVTLGALPPGQWRYLQPGESF